MNKICQQYLSEIKTFFPIMGKPEKKYLANLSSLLEDYYIEENVNTVEELYNGFGHPSEIISTYLTSVDTSRLIKRIRLTNWVKRGIITLLLIISIGVSIYGITSYKAYEIFEEEEIFFEETEITD